jgi:hypothetical protein
MSLESNWESLNVMHLNKFYLTFTFHFTIINVMLQCNFTGDYENRH